MREASKIVPLRCSHAESGDRMTVTLSGPRDPRLVALVRLLARQAADEYFEAAAAERAGDPKQ